MFASTSARNISTVIRETNCGTIAPTGAAAAQRERSAWPRKRLLALHGHTDGHLLLDAIEIERQRNRMMRQTMGFRHAVVDAHNGELVAVMRSPDDAYDYCDYFATARRDATVLDLWLRFKASRLFQCVFWVYNCSLFRLCRSSLVYSLRSSYRL